MSPELPTSLIHPDSLGDTLDAINAALFDHLELPVNLRTEAAIWISERQGLPGSYASMFAPTEYDYAFGAMTFTGEPIRSGAATGHILSEESLAALYHLGVDSPEVRDAIRRARVGIFKRLEQSEVKGQWSGVYCCGTCSVSLWRHLIASGEPEDARRIENGLSELHRYRDGEGRWKRFPFFYTLFALIEIDHPAALPEIHYAEKVIERAQRRLLKHAETKHDQRRRLVLERILEKC